MNCLFSKPNIAGRLYRDLLREDLSYFKRVSFERDPWNESPYQRTDLFTSSFYEHFSALHEADLDSNCEFDLNNFISSYIVNAIDMSSISSSGSLL